MNRVLVTGATGFVGRTLCATLVESGYTVRAATRGTAADTASAAEHVSVGDIGGATDWSAALEGVELVVHAAARAHILHDSAANSQLYVATNTDGTVCLANAAARAGVRRLVYISSIKVNGEETRGQRYTGADEPRPQDSYGASKWLAEKALADIASRTRLETVVVRPPLVYGPGVRANFLRLLRWVDSGLPLPLGAIHNQRSLVSIWNLCDLLVKALEHPAASRATLMVSDANDLSTPELIRRMAAAMRRRARLLPVPIGMLRVVGHVTGRRRELDRLCGSLVVDISKTRELLGWSPPMSFEEGLSRTVSWYLSEGR